MGLEPTTLCVQSRCSSQTELQPQLLLLLEFNFVLSSLQPFIDNTCQSNKNKYLLFLFFYLTRKLSRKVITPLKNVQLFQFRRIQNPTAPLLVGQQTNSNYLLAGCCPGQARTGGPLISTYGQSRTTDIGLTYDYQWFYSTKLHKRFFVQQCFLTAIQSDALTD